MSVAHFTISSLEIAWWLFICSCKLLPNFFPLHQACRRVKGSHRRACVSACIYFQLLPVGAELDWNRQTKKTLKILFKSHSKFMIKCLIQIWRIFPFWWKCQFECSKANQITASTVAVSLGILSINRLVLKCPNAFSYAVQLYLTDGGSRVWASFFIRTTSWPPLKLSDKFI